MTTCVPRVASAFRPLAETQLNLTLGNPDERTYTCFIHTFGKIVKFSW